MTRFLGPVPPPDQPWQLLWPDLETGPFRLRLWFDRVNDVVGVVGVEMWGVEPRSGDWSVSEELPSVAIRAEDIHLRLGELRDWWTQMQAAWPRAARAAWEALPEELRKPRDVHEAAVREFERRVSSKERRPGRPFLTDEHLTRVTEIYNAEVEAGGRRPTQRVADELNARTYKTAQGWVSVARKRGYPVLPVPQKRAELSKEEEE